MRAFAQVLSSMKPRLKLPLMFTKNLRRSMLAEDAKFSSRFVADFGC